MSNRLCSFLLFVIKYKYPELLAYINVSKNLIRLYPQSSICLSLPFSDLDPFAIIKVEFETKQVEKLRISVNVPQGYMNEKIGTKIKKYRIQLNKTINLRSNVNTMRGLPANIIHTMDALLAFKVSFICAQKNIFIGYIHDCIIVSPSD
jgi:DNA-directed RNA polymerase